jgi:hypothetical protein
VRYEFLSSHLEELLADIARQAVNDWRAGYHKQRHMDAAMWLQLAGLMMAEGELDVRGYGARRCVLQAADDATPTPISKLIPLASKQARGTPRGHRKALNGRGVVVPAPGLEQQAGGKQLAL